jgi:hypothetical protein
MRTQMIESHIGQLKGSFGFKKPIEDPRLRDLYRGKDYLGMAGVMMSIFNIDLKLKLGLVNSGGPNAPAWVNKPKRFPYLFSPQYRNTEVTVYLRKSFLAEVNFESTVLALAHEFSHIVLDSVNHPLKKHEEAVDLTAMLLGFRDIYVTGSVIRKNDVEHQFGYLSLEEVKYAASYMTYGR